ncbi:MAG: phosphoribosyl-ATP diphosphatase [Amphiplicatus sp.]
MRNESDTLGAALDRLAATIEARRGADPETSYTAFLLAGGPARCAKKFGEEATETVIAAVEGDAAALAGEAADALYHLLALLAAAGVPPEAVAAALARREGVSGHAEKAARKRD